jgi:hypothetical protein
MSEPEYMYEKEREPAFVYHIENDFGDIYLYETDPTGRVVYNKWFLFNKHECDELKLAYAIAYVKKTVVDPRERKAIVLDVISSCLPVVKKIKKMKVW